MPKHKFKIGDYAKQRFVGQFANIPFETIGKVVMRSKSRGCTDRVLVRFGMSMKDEVWESEQYLDTVTVSGHMDPEPLKMNWPPSADKPLYS